MALQFRSASHVDVEALNLVPEKHVKHLSGSTLSHVEQMSLHLTLHFDPSDDTTNPVAHFVHTVAEEHSPQFVKHFRHLFTPLESGA